MHIYIYIYIRLHYIFPLVLIVFLVVLYGTAMYDRKGNLGPQKTKILIYENCMHVLDYRCDCNTDSLRSVYVI